MYSLRVKCLSARLVCIIAVLVLAGCDMTQTATPTDATSSSLLTMILQTLVTFVVDFGRQALAAFLF